MTFESRIVGTYRRCTTVDDDAGVYVGGRGEDRHGMPLDIAKGEWAIWLPHDCDEWIIASGDREAVLAKGREFVSSVQAALDALEAEGQTPPG